MEPRPAATVVVARQGRLGIEVLVLERSASSRFAPGFLVFPGGALEPGDERLAERWFGDVSEAARACAVRELYEEAGILLTREGPVAAGASRPPIEEVEFTPPDRAALPEMARWIAPPFLPRRFDARFFAVGASPALEPSPDGVEIERAWWASADEVVDLAVAGRASLMWPTLKTLQALGGCASVDEVLALRVEQVEPGVEDMAPAVRAPGNLPWREPEA